MVVETLLAALVASVGVFAGAILGFLFSLRVARRKEIRRKKQEVYEGIIPVVEESVQLLGQLRELSKLNFVDQTEAVNNLWQTYMFMFDLGDPAALSKLVELSQKAEQSGYDESFFTDTRDLVGSAAFARLSKNGRKFRQLRASLRLVSPTPEVRDRLDEVVDTYSTDWADLIMRRLCPWALEMGTLEPNPRLKNRPESYATSMDGLKQAMAQDLRRTL